MRIFDGLARLFLGCIMAGVLLAGVIVPYTMGIGLAANKTSDAVQMADIELLDMSKMPLRTTITDDAGEPLAYIFDQNRFYLTLSQISDLVQKAVISIEDRRFKLHHGVDWQGTTRALLKTSSGEMVQGGSTITQQLVKNYLYLVQARTPAEKADAIARTPIRKLREAKIALQYESTHTKNQILEEYLNLVAFGPNTYGVGAASEHFFGVSADRLSLSQAALLAAMINNPNRYNPLVGSQVQETLDRRNLVLDSMFRDGYISAKSRDEAKDRSIAQDLNASFLPNGCIDAVDHATRGYFCRYVLDYLQNSGLDYDEIARGGYTIVTSMNAKAMDAAITAVQAGASPDDEDASRIANVIAVVEPGAGTRKVLALAANRPYGLDQSKGETVQRLVTTFAPLGAGGVFKLFTAAAAMDAGLGTGAVIPIDKTYSSPLVPSYEFSNTGKFSKSMSIAAALAQQPNTGFIRLQDEVGLPEVVDMAVKLGLRGYTLDAGEVERAFSGIGATYQDLIPAQKIASFSLGVSPVSPLELANVGATLDSDGLWCPPTPITSITDRRGSQVVWDRTPCEQVVPPELAHTLSNALTATMSSKKGVGYDTAQLAEWKRHSASIAGSTLQYKSAAFLGYTPYYSAAAMTWDYLGHPQPICVAPIRTCELDEASSDGAGMTGSTIPQATWLATMIPMHRGLADSPFPVSDAQYLVGSADSQIPDVEGMQLANAKSTLEAFGFPDVEVSYDSEVALPTNTVISQDPKQSALPGAVIKLVVAAGAGTSGSSVPSGDSDGGWSGGDDGFGGDGG